MTQLTGWLKTDSDTPALVRAVLFSVLLLGSTTGTAMTGPGSAADTALVAGGGVFAAMVMLCAAGAYLHRRLLGTLEPQLIAAVHAPATRPDETVVIRAAGDEASGLLVAGQFVGWLNAVATRLLTNLWFWAVLIGMPLLAFVVARVVGVGGRLAFDLLMYAFVATGPVVVAVVAAMAWSGLVFGIDGPFASLVASCSAESAPPGAATLLQLEPRTTARKGLAHSSLYDDDQVIRYIVSAVRARPVPESKVGCPAPREAVFTYLTVPGRSSEVCAA